MSTTVQITFDCHDLAELSRFWAEALGYVLPPPPGVTLSPGADPLAAWEDFLKAAGIPEEERRRRSAAEDPEGVGPRLYFQKVPEEKVVKNRMHLDVRTAPGLTDRARAEAQEAECRRLVGLGATRLHRVEPQPPFDGGFIVMADPEGNEFCLD